MLKKNLEREKKYYIFRMEAKTVYIAHCIRIKSAKQK